MDLELRMILGGNPTGAEARALGWDNYALQSVQRLTVRKAVWDRPGDIPGAVVIAHLSANTTVTVLSRAIMYNALWINIAYQTSSGRRTGWVHGTGMVRLGGGAANGNSVPHQNLTESQKIFIAAIASEAIGQGATAQRAVGHVIMNRVADRTREWRNLNTVTAVIQQPWAFSGVHQQSAQYTQALAYLNNRTGSNTLYENLIITVMPIYLGTARDTTSGAVLFYSPRSMIPAGSLPSWDFNQLSEITIAGIDPWYFRFFKYK